MHCNQLRSIKCPLVSLYQYFPRHVAYNVFSSYKLRLYTTVVRADTVS
jgi:hypothetical protein